MRFYRPRISILTAVLLMTIVGMAIVIVKLGREVHWRRIETRKLRDEVGQLSIDDASKVHAMGVRTNERLSWKWRVWVPEGANVSLHQQWGDVPRTGVPASRPADPLDAGEQWISMHVVQDPLSGGTYAKFESKQWGFGIPIKEQDRWWTWSNDAMQSEGVQHETGVQEDRSKPLVLTRYRTVPTGNSDDLHVDAPTPGFIIWLERH